MAYTPLFITDFKEGLVKNREQFLLPNDAFTELENAFIWRGVIHKKNGYRLLGHLERKLEDQVLGNAVLGAFSGNIITLLTLEESAKIKPGFGTTPHLIITVDSGGANEETFLEPVAGTITPDGTLVGSNGGTGTINYNTGDITLISNATWTTEEVVITFRYMPCLPVMGLFNTELEAINAEDLIAFDTKYAYRYSNTNERFNELIPGTTWNGDNKDFFSLVNYWQNNKGNLSFVTNFNAGATPDPIRYYDTTAWTDFTPDVDATNKLFQARWLLPFKGRLLAFDTYEGVTNLTTTNHPNRLRYSWVGNPLDAEAFRSDIIGKGGYIDATTSERIVSVNRIKDTVIVGFERSMYTIRYTGNEILPFVWEKVNGTLGIESPFSTIEFDKGIIGFGQSDLVSCNGYDVERIDTKIPDLAENIENDTNGHLRVHGYYDKYRELSYFCYPRSNQSNAYPDRVLCFNPNNNSFSIFKDRLTTFGGWQPFDDTTWTDLDYLKWSEWSTPWNQSGINSLLPNVAAGNHNGAVVVYNDANKTLNDPATLVTAVGSDYITSPNHGLDHSDFISIEGIIGKGSELNGNIYKVFPDGDDLYLFEKAEGGYTGGDFQPVEIAAGTYFGNGRLSIVNNLYCKSKRFNFLAEGVSTKLGYLDFIAKRTAGGLFNVNLYSNSSGAPINGDLTERSNEIATFPHIEESGDIDQVIRRLYANSVAKNVQFEIFIDDKNMMDKSVVSSDIDISGITVWAEGAGRIIT